MFSRKSKQPSAVPMPAFALAMPTAPRGYDALYEQLRAGGEVHNTAACRLEGELWLVRTYKTDPFRLVLRVHGAWYDLCDVRSDDPAVRALQEAGHIIEYGPTPDQVEKNRQREDEKRREREAEEAFHRDRREIIERQIARNEAARRAALAARQ